MRKRGELEKKWPTRQVATWAGSKKGIAQGVGGVGNDRREYRDSPPPKHPNSAIRRGGDGWWDGWGAKTPARGGYRSGDQTKDKVFFVYNRVQWRRKWKKTTLTRGETSSWSILSCSCRATRSVLRGERLRRREKLGGPSQRRRGSLSLQNYQDMTATKPTHTPTATCTPREGRKRGTSFFRTIQSPESNVLPREAKKAFREG